MVNERYYSQRPENCGNKGLGNVLAPKGNHLHLVGLVLWWILETWHTRIYFLTIIDKYSYSDRIQNLICYVGVS